jgi:phosphate transport system substrate-binding protein
MKRVMLVAMAVVAVAASAGAQTTVNGAGATFPYPIYSKWFDEYHKLHQDVQINYQSLGSGAGIQQLLSGTVDFGASDMPMTPEQMKQAKVPIMHFPTVLGGVVPTYNLAGISQPLRFSGSVLADIFLGKITRWNDPAIAKINPGVRLPAEDIIVVHRSDGSGTTFVWTDFLSKVSPEWKSQVGSNTSVRWPVGLGNKGNEGVAGLVKQTPDAIGYVELIYAIQNRMPYGLVQNAAGTFVKAELATVTEAAAGAAANMPADFRVSITDAPGRNAYPISSFTWLLIPSRWTDATKGRIMLDFLRWMATDGQKFTQALSYAPLPSAVVQKELQAMKQIQVGAAR